LKKRIGIFLFLCLTAPFVLCYSWLSIQRMEIRKEVKCKIRAGLDKKDLVLFVFSINDSKTLHWKNPHEFRYRQQMYDVVEKKARGDSVIYWCYWDRKESSIDKLIDDLVAGVLEADTQEQETQKQLITYLKTYYITNPFSWNPDMESRMSRYTRVQPCSYCPWISEPPSPPPKMS